MKTNTLFIVFLFFITLITHGQNYDTIFFMKNGQIINLQSIKTSDVDSITFYPLGGGGVGGDVAASPAISPDGGLFHDDVTVSLTSSTPGATIHYSLDSSYPTNLYSAPFSLGMGAKTIRAKATAPGLYNSEESSASFLVVPTGKNPFLGDPLPIPGRIKMVDYDTGGQNLAYFDNTPSNQGYNNETSNYRNVDGPNVEAVDIWFNDVEGWYTGANAPNEWREYIVNVAITGGYNVDLRYCTGPGLPGQIRIELDGINISGPIEMPSTIDYNDWQTINHKVNLTKGLHVLRVFHVLRGTNLNWLDFTLNP
ncbi:MAG TPA: chitobiase/beta-hexosaminidase C-terminal domain-containing protein [Prolixibacteraceae bacterium]|jgi:hypothetical protein|nr:chitobiase/beta-hexosaminidase C-terminal domain-containing protein [Paludibacter sp.]HOS91086.1 chitobiase/beta-hexosaminidase C-terminal domain-containing protein [Prolixibacteraceae bacterium]HQE52947.1 chitobiase/beta-hexosaminidase C-terminal domain-containing protein [Prolixibacteraceae bacterium]HQH77044.1 chitobiase/beta-hexosaminidase C-terminal domain-containing protein [Prolixibacteraceae bacterium]HQJ86307.1 chitobiase/beta-hexosaminidase C-terminal domain-containing protein [Pro